MCAEVLRGPGLSLPVEVLEMVLAQLPHAYLMTTCFTVCRHWSEVISNPAFIPWKKFYHRLKVAPSSKCCDYLLSHRVGGTVLDASKVMAALCSEHGVASLSTCLVSIIRLVGSTQKVPQGASEDLLQSHPLYHLALETLRNLNHDLLPQPQTLWHVVAMIVILSKDVWHVDSLIRLMLREGSLFTPCEVVEAFYCMATFLLHCSKEFQLPTRYHYLVYYALYLYENCWTTKPMENAKSKQPACLGQQSLEQYVKRDSPLQYTHEQLRIINHQLQPDHVVKIVAFAGTGKTSTLLQMCQQRPQQDFLLVVFNKSVQEHCSNIFPRNTKVMTAHAMAYAVVGRRYGAIKKLAGNLYSSKIADFLERKENAGNRQRRAALVKNTLNNFLSTTDRHITLQHVPQTDREGNHLEDDYRLRVLLPDSESVWAEMTRCSPYQRLSMTQDGQLKLWQLKNPQLDGYDVVMIDEGQDMNAAMFDIFLKQPCAKVIVGDPYQQIYSFRGAVNALHMVPSTHTFYLTQSFRFGPEVAYMAHCVLSSLLGVQGQTIVGGRKKDSITTEPEAMEARIPGGTQRRAYLGRSNLEVYKVALSLCQDMKFKTHTMSFAGGIEKYDLDTVMDLYKLSQVEKGKGTPESLEIKNKLVARFNSVDRLQKFAENLDDHELVNKISMYKFSREATPKHLQLLRNRCSCPQARAQITFSTIHKAKGLEWDWVTLLDDINPLNMLCHNPSSMQLGDEFNLLYVAITRAKTFLTLNTAALYTLLQSGDKLEVVAAGKEAGPAGRCLQCGSPIDSNAPLITQVTGLRLGQEDDQFTGGFLCRTCSCFPSFVTPLTSRYRDLMRFRLIKDHSRIARLMLLCGKLPEDWELMHEPAMDRGWHQYVLRIPSYNMGLVDRLLFFDVVSSDSEDDVQIIGPP